MEKTPYNSMFEKDPQEYTAKNILNWIDSLFVIYIDNSLSAIEIVAFLEDPFIDEKLKDFFAKVFCERVLGTSYQDTDKLVLNKIRSNVDTFCEALIKTENKRMKIYRDLCKEKLEDIDEFLKTNQTKIKR